MKNNPTIVKWLSLLIVLSLFPLMPSSAMAQSEAPEIRFQIAQINDEEYPKVQAYVAVNNTLSQPVSDLVEDNFIVLDGGVEITDYSFSLVVNEQQPLTIVLLMDTSNDFWLPYTQVIASNLVNELKEQDQVAVASIATGFNLRQDLTTDKQVVQDAIKALGFEGKPQVALADALIGSDQTPGLFSKLSGISGPKVIILFHNSTYEEAESPPLADLLDTFINSAVLSGIQFVTLGLGDPGRVFEDELVALAEETGGYSIVADVPLLKVNEFEDTFFTSNLAEDFYQMTDALNNLRTQYLIEFTSNFPPDGEERELTVQVSRQGWEARAVRTYIACPGVLKVCLADYIDGQIVGGNVCFAPVIHPFDPPPSQVDFYLDGQFQTSKTDPAAFEYCINTTDVPEKAHEVKIKATDEDGQTGELAIELYMRPPIKVEVTKPAENDVLSGPLTILGSVDSLFPLETIRFILNGEELSTVEKPALPLSGPPYIYTIEEKLDVSQAKMVVGDQTLVVSALDEMENSEEREVQVAIVVGGASEKPADSIWGVIIIAIAVVAVVVFVSISLRRKRKSGAVLRELQGLFPNRVITLGEQEVRLGRRAADNDIQLKGTTASRMMAVIRYQNGKHYIISLNSQNPVLVDNVPVQEHPLTPGSEIRAGESVFRYEG